MFHNTKQPDSEADLEIVRKQTSDYAMALDSLTRITHSGSEKEAIESILQLFNLLFLPGKLLYVSFTDRQPTQIYSLSKLVENESEIKKRLGNFIGKYVWTESQKGFQIKIRFGNTELGILEVDNVGFPEHKEHYLNLTMSLTDVCGLAIENSRRLQVIKEAGKKLREEKEKLEEALLEVKRLSGLLPICSHCKKIRDDKGYWNQIESYIHEHSEAKFSHSICQECAEKYYPDMDLYGD